MDSTITTIAAPTIVREIGGGESLIKWLGASYALAMGVLLVVGGRLGDRYGARRLFLVGIGGFVAASLMAGLSVDPTMLIGARLVQGGFGALLIPQGFGILTATFSREQPPRAFVAFGPVLCVSAVLGPIVAGFLIKADIAGLSWRPMFLMNILIGGVGLVAAVKLLPPDGPTRDVRIDGLGAGLLAASMLGLMYGLIEGSTAGWTAVPVPACWPEGWPSSASASASCSPPTRSSCPRCSPTGALRPGCCSAWPTSPPSTAWPSSSRCPSRPPSVSRPQKQRSDSPRSCWASSPRPSWSDR